MDRKKVQQQIKMKNLKVKVNNFIERIGGNKRPTLIVVKADAKDEYLSYVHGNSVEIGCLVAILMQSEDFTEVVRSALNAVDKDRNNNSN